MTETRRYPPFQGRGFAFPPALDPRWGRFEMAEGEDDIQQAIRIIIGTGRGERVMRPDFGCGIHDLSFEVVNAQTVAEIRRVVREALTRFEARIDVTGVRVDTSQSISGILRIELDYRIRTTNQPGNFVFPFYIPEGR
ncbi:baseplate protein [Rhodobacterales bacterium HKCCE3408]|nr:baseplate protein [Rhodobacterales bacterium HKCCE3408]